MLVSIPRFSGLLNTLEQLLLRLDGYLIVQFKEHVTRIKKSMEWHVDGHVH